MKILPNKEQYSKWSLPSKYGFWALILAIIGILIYIASFFQSKPITKEDIKDLVTNERLDSILSIQLKSIEISENLELSKSHKGYSYQMMIYLDERKVDSRQFIFDSGDDFEKDRISLYLDTDNNLCFRIIDENKEVYTLKVPSGDNTFKFNELMFLICEFAKSDTAPFMKLYVNLKDIANLVLPFSFRLAENINLKHTTIGCDLNGSNCVSFVISMFANGRKTFSTEEKRKLFNINKWYLSQVNPEWTKQIKP